MEIFSRNRLNLNNTNLNSKISKFNFSSTPFNMKKIKKRFERCYNPSNIFYKKSHKIENEINNEYETNSFKECYPVSPQKEILLHQLEEKKKKKLCLRIKSKSKGLNNPQFSGNNVRNLPNFNDLISTKNIINNLNKRMSNIIIATKTPKIDKMDYPIYDACPKGKINEFKSRIFKYLTKMNCCDTDFGINQIRDYSPVKEQLFYRSNSCMNHSSKYDQAENNNKNDSFKYNLSNNIKNDSSYRIPQKNLENNFPSNCLGLMTNKEIAIQSFPKNVKHLSNRFISNMHLMGETLNEEMKLLSNKLIYYNFQKYKRNSFNIIKNIRLFEIKDKSNSPSSPTKDRKNPNINVQPDSFQELIFLKSNQNQKDKTNLNQNLEGNNPTGSNTILSKERIKNIKKEFNKNIAKPNLRKVIDNLLSKQNNIHDTENILIPEEQVTFPSEKHNLLKNIEKCKQREKIKEASINKKDQLEILEIRNQDKSRYFTKNSLYISNELMNEDLTHSIINEINNIYKGKISKIKLVNNKLNDLNFSLILKNARDSNCIQALYYEGNEINVLSLCEISCLLSSVPQEYFL